MQEKIKIYHFHNGSGGGVLTVIQNLLRYKQHQEIENHVIYTINQEVTQKFKYTKVVGAASETVFYYSPKWNFYYTCKQLVKLLPNDKGIIVAHDWIELGMVSNLGLQNPAVLFLHGNYDYYFELAKKHAKAIDGFICISRPIYNNLKKELGNTGKNIFLDYFPVPDLQGIAGNNFNLNIFYGVRSLTDLNKQFLLLPKIDRLLQEAGVIVRWTVLGRDGAEDEVKDHLQGLQNISYYPQLENKEVLKLLATQDVFVLPSYNEGLPVALVEAMKAGVVPLITNWHGATEELVIEGISGFYIEKNNSAKYAAIIVQLDNNRELLKKISINASEIARRQFDPCKNTFDIEQHLITAANEKKVKHAKKVYGSRLDNEYIPNRITTFLRHRFR